MNESIKLLNAFTGTEIKSAMFLMLFEMVYPKEILALLMDAPKYSLPVRLPKDK